eukprot:172619-Pyramimonas_sp.AAC.1
MGMRADEGTFMNAPTTSASRPYTHDEYPKALVFEKNPITEEEASGYMNVSTSVKTRLGVGAEAPHGHAWYDAV